MPNIRSFWQGRECEVLDFLYDRKIKIRIRLLDTGEIKIVDWREIVAR